MKYCNGLLTFLKAFLYKGQGTVSIINANQKLYKKVYFSLHFVVLVDTERYVYNRLDEIR